MKKNILNGSFINNTHKITYTNTQRNQMAESVNTFKELKAFVFLHRYVANMLKVIMKDDKLKAFVISHEEPFMFDKSKMLTDLDIALSSDGHSGASFACCLRQCQALLIQEKL